jgi:heterodisulfide reductase subunit C
MEHLKTDKIEEFTDDMADLLRDAGFLEIGSCIQCGTCSGGCPSGRRTALKTRSLVRKAQLGLDEVLSDKELWFCSTCYTCHERCPRAVPVTDMIIFLRNLAVQRGYIQAPHLALCKMFYNTGHGVPINDEKWNKLREFYKLSSIPPTTHKYPDAEKEVQTLLKSTGFDKLTGVGDYEKKADLADVNSGG